MSWWLRSSQARRPGSPDLPPLADQLPGVPVDPLAGLLVEVQPDAVDVGRDLLVGVTLRPADQGREGVPDLLAFDVGHNGFEVGWARPGIRCSAGWRAGPPGCRW